MEPAEVRCINCNRLLFRGHAIRLQIKCPRCKKKQIIGRKDTGKSRKEQEEPHAD